MKPKALFVMLILWLSFTTIQARSTEDVPDKGTYAKFLLVGCYMKPDEEGVRMYRFDGQTADVDYPCGLRGISNPAFLTSDSTGNRIYAIGDDEGKSSTANALLFDKESGLLSLLNSQSTDGELPIYITLSPKEYFVLTANYKGGSITVFSQDKKGKLQRDTKIIRFAGNGPNKKRQEQSHLHCVTFTPDGKFLLATDLGTDCIYLFPIGKRPEAGKAHSLLDESRVVRIQMDSGSGPRHICFHPNGRFAYLISELSGKITVFSYNEGKLERLQTIVCDPFVAEGNADIHVSSDGKFLYASKHLKEDGIIVYSIDSQKGTLVQIGFSQQVFYREVLPSLRIGCYLAVVCRVPTHTDIRKKPKYGVTEEYGKKYPTGKTGVCQVLINSSLNRKQYEQVNYNHRLPDMLYRLYAGTKQGQYVKQERTKYCRHQYVCRTWQSGQPQSDPCQRT